MKLRLKWNGSRSTISIDEHDASPLTVQSVTDTVSQALPVDSGFRLSLNGRDPLEAEPDTALSTLGIVGGDLIHVLSNVPSPNAAVKLDDVDKKGETASISKQGSTVKNCEKASGCDVMIKEAASEDVIESSSKPDNMETDQGEPKADPSLHDVPDEVEDDPEAIRDDLVNRYLREPVLVCEATEQEVPQSLHALYVSAEVANAAEAVIVVTHQLMTESGYITQDSLPSDCMPLNWRSPGACTLKYTHSAEPETVFTVTLIPMGQLSIIHGKVRDCHCKLQLKTGDYVTETLSDALSCYRRLPQLSNNFKDAIAHKMLAAISADTAAVVTLNSLMPELKLLIMRLLGAGDLARLSQTCRTMSTMCQSAELWRRLYLTDFGRRGSRNELNHDWRKIYREKYIERKRQRAYRQRLMQDMYPPPPWGQQLPHPPLPFTPVYPPGFVGGEYDRNPTGLGPLPGASPFSLRPRIDPISGVPTPNNPFRPGPGGGMYDPGVMGPDLNPLGGGPGGLNPLRRGGGGGLNPGGRRGGFGGGFGQRFF